MFIQTKNTKGYEALSKVKYSTKELQFHIEPSRFLVEQPPQTAGQISKQANNEK